MAQDFIAAVSKAEETFETVSKNLKSWGATPTYLANGDIDFITLSDGSSNITKTLGYDAGGNLTSVTLSGDTPSGIDLTKTLTLDANGDLVSVSYS